MTRTKIKATRYAFGLEEESYHLFMIQESDERYLMIQKACEFDQQDHDLGMDTYYLEINGQANARYGGVVSIAIKYKEIEIALADQIIVLEITDCDLDVNEVFKNLKEILDL